MDKGTALVSQLTDAEIDSMEGNGLMTAEFVKGLVRAARAVAKECDQGDIWDYIQTETNPKGRVGRIEIYSDDVAELDTWYELCDQVGVDHSENYIGGMFILDER